MRDREDDKIGALDAGADDYVTKPFSVAELLARIRVALRRVATVVEAPGVFEHAGLRIDFADRRVALHGEPLALTRKEYALLLELVRHAGRVITHAHLLRAVWGPVHEHDTQYLRVFIRQLREKLGDDSTDPRWIATEAGVGYRWVGTAYRRPEFCRHRVTRASGGSTATLWVWLRVLVSRCRLRPDVKAPRHRA